MASSANQQKTDPTMPASPRLIVGITGASGVLYGIRLLDVLRPTPIETHLILSDSARLALTYETTLKPRDIEQLATAVHPFRDVAACVSSGSFATLGMVIAPCSMRSLAEIATGVTSSLLTRAADVVLKERRRLVLVTREAPLNLVHLRNMVTVTEMGAIVFPPVPAFYAKPATLDELVDYTVRRVLDLFDVDEAVAPIPRWGEQLGRQR
jgi:flavin prenyltransferase